MKKTLILFLGLYLFLQSSFAQTTKSSTSSKCPMEFLGGTWEGTYTSFSKFKIVMQVTKIEGCNFEGHIDWIDYGYSQTKIKGYYKDGKLYFTEVAKVHGPSHRLNTEYIATWNGEPEFEGNNYDNGRKAGHFKLKRMLS